MGAELLKRHNSYALSILSRLKLVAPTHPQSVANVLGDLLLAAEHRMAAQLVLQLPALVAIDPAEDPWIVLRCAAVGDPVGPVLRESMLPGGGLQARGTDLQSHDHIRFRVLGVVAPQGVQLLLHTTLTC